MKKMYLGLALLGAVAPYAFFLPFFQEHGVSLPKFLSSLFVNGAAGGFTTDLFISSFVFWLFMFSEHRRSKGPSPYLYLLLNLTIGLSCAFPAYLFAREATVHGDT